MKPAPVLDCGCTFTGSGLSSKDPARVVWCQNHKAAETERPADPAFRAAIVKGLREYCGLPGAAR